MAQEGINDTYKKFAQKYGIKSEAAAAEASGKKRGKKGKEDANEVIAQFHETIKNAAKGYDIGEGVPQRRQDVKNSRVDELEREVTEAV